MTLLKGKQNKCVVTYVPHGINGDIFKPVEVPSEFKKTMNMFEDFKFVVFWMNRNIKRKHPGDVIWAYKKFVDKLPEKDRKSVVLLMHTQAVDENGTDLVAVKEAICPNYYVMFSEARISQPDLNYLYNMADVTVNIAGNEGFGLTTAESLMAHTPIIVQVTGGLQDQCGFTLDGKNISADEYKELGTVHDYKVWEKKLKHGEWVTPVWPRTRSMMGSVPTPYIEDDFVDVDEVSDALFYWYNMSREERKARGAAGRKWMEQKEIKLTNGEMCLEMAKSIELTIANFEVRERYKIHKIR